MRSLPVRGPAPRRADGFDAGRPEAPVKAAVARGVERLRDGMEAPARSLASFTSGVREFAAGVERASSTPGSGAVGHLAWPLTLSGKPLRIPLEPLRGLDLDPVRRLLERILPQTIDDPQGDRFRADTRPFRDAVTVGRSLAEQLERLPKDDPRRPLLESAVAAAGAHLEQVSGYTLDTAPRPGALWVDPQFLAGELTGGTIHASRFPTGTPVTRPPRPEAVLFGGDPSRLAAYKAEVARTRQASGMPVQGGEPVGVHLNLQGGGGRGKRYGAMLEELSAQGVVPVSVTGSSAGSIAAAVIATGAPADTVAALAKDPRLAKLYDYDLDLSDGGLLDGQVAYDLVDQTLRELTGISDRPVTFADLKMPLQVVAAVASDSSRSSFPTAKDRVFVFSQETTPDTPVALAVRASLAIPGVFEPVQVVDPVTGRAMQLVDGGTVDNLPVGYGGDGLPRMNVTLYGRGDSHPSRGAESRNPVPQGPLDVDNIVWNAVNGYTMLLRSNTGADDWKDLTRPEPGEFGLALPVWDLTDPRNENGILEFGFDPRVDPVLDGQTRGVVRAFLADVLDELGTPGARGTNVTATIPPGLRFEETATVKGTPYRVEYRGGESLTTIGADGKRTEVKLGREAIERMWLDGQAFGDLSAQLSYALSTPRSLGWSWLPF